jgi:hypothetical protein
VLNKNIQKIIFISYIFYCLKAQNKVNILRVQVVCLFFLHREYTGDNQVASELLSTEIYIFQHPPSIFRVIILRPSAQLQQVSVGMVEPVGCAHFHRSLSLGLLDLPLFDVQLHVPRCLIAAAPHLDRQQVMRHRVHVQLFKVLVNGDDGVSRVNGHSQALRIPANVRVQVDDFAALLHQRELWRQLHEARILAAHIQMRLAPLGRRRHAKDLLDIVLDAARLEERQRGSLVAEHVMQKPIGADAVLERVVDLRPVRGKYGHEFGHEGLRWQDGRRWR